MTERRMTILMKYENRTETAKEVVYFESGICNLSEALHAITKIQFDVFVVVVGFMQWENSTTQKGVAGEGWQGTTSVEERALLMIPSIILETFLIKV